MQYNNNDLDNWLDRYMDGDLTDEDWKAIDKKIQEDPLFAKNFALDLAILRGGRTTVAMPQNKESENSLSSKSIIEPIPLKKNVLFRRLGIAALAASFALLAIFAYKWWDSQKKYSELITENSKLENEKAQLLEALNNKTQSPDKEINQKDVQPIDKPIVVDKGQKVKEQNKVENLKVPIEIVIAVREIAHQEFTKDKNKNLGTASSKELWETYLLQDSLKKAQLALEQVTTDKNNSSFYKTALMVLNKDKTKFPIAIESLQKQKELKKKLARTLLILAYLEQGDVANAKIELKEAEEKQIALSLPPSVQEWLKRQ